MRIFVCLLALAQLLSAWQGARLLNHRVRVPAGGGNYLCFGVTTPRVLAGNFRAAGGKGNDIVVAVAEEEEAINWANGHAAQLLWWTEEKRTTGSFRVPLDPGRYCVAMSNHFSAVSDKQVTVQADLVYRMPSFMR